MFIPLLLCVITLADAQETKVINDLLLWTGAKVEKSFAKDWMVSLEQEIRFKHNISEISNTFTETGLRYRISKNFSLEGGFRYTWDKKKNGTYQGLSRYNFDLRYKGKIDFLTIYYRLRYQKEVEDFAIFDLSAPYEKQLRNRFTIRLNSLKSISPYVSGEIFQIFTPHADPRFGYCRMLAGIRYEPGRMGEFNVAWGFNRELSSSQPAMIYMFNVNYTYKL